MKKELVRFRKTKQPLGFLKKTKGGMGDVYFFSGVVDEKRHRKTQ